MKRKNKPLLIMIFIILVIFGTAFGGAFLIRNVFEGVRITVNFSDTKNLSQNSPIEYQGIQIGSIVSIQNNTNANVPVLIKIDSKHSEHLRKNAIFVISSSLSSTNEPGILMGYCKDADPYSLPKMVSGEVIDGENSEIIFLVKTRVGCFDQTIDSFSKALENLKININSMVNSSKVQQIYQDMEKFLMDINSIIHQKIQNFIKEKGSEIRKKIEDLIKELEQFGYEKEAEKWKKFLQEEFQQET